MFGGTWGSSLMILAPKWLFLLNSGNEWPIMVYYQDVYLFGTKYSRLWFTLIWDWACTHVLHTCLGHLAGNQCSSRNKICFMLWLFTTPPKKFILGFDREFTHPVGNCLSHFNFRINVELQTYKRSMWKISFSSSDRGGPLNCVNYQHRMIIPRVYIVQSHLQYMAFLVFVLVTSLATYHANIGIQLRRVTI